MIKCAIFDLDGTLVNSMEYWSIVPSKFLENNGIKVEDKKSLSDMFLSMSLLESSKYFKETYKFSKSIEEIALEIDRVMEEYYLNNVTLKSGIKELLELLYSKGIKMAIATATDKFLVEEVIEKLGIKKYFDFIITSTEVGSSKKNPLIYQKCAEFFNAKESESIIFEDLPYGIISGNSVGFHTVGLYDKPSKHLQDKIKENADIYIEELNAESISKINELMDKCSKKFRPNPTQIILLILIALFFALAYYRLVPHKLSLVIPASKIESVEVCYYDSNDGYFSAQISSDKIDEFKDMLKKATYVLTFTGTYKYISECEVLITYENGRHKGFGSNYLSTLVNPRLCFQMNFDIYGLKNLVDESTKVPIEYGALTDKLESYKK